MSLETPLTDHILAESVFSPFVCNFCKSTSDDLKVCTRCRLISYCCVEHQKKNWPAHQRVCRAVGIVLKKFKSNSIFEIALSEENWVSVRSLAMCLTETVLKDSLNPSEKQLFLFPSACIVCRSFKINKSLVCKNCKSVVYCSLDHKDQHVKEHLTVCEELKLCFDLSCHMAKNNCDLSSDLETLKSNVKHGTLPKNMSTFISQFIPKDVQSSHCSEFSTLILSEMLTCITTIIYSIEKGDVLSKLNKDLRIIVIGSEASEGLESYLVKYIEIIPHWFINLTDINITFVSPTGSAPAIPNLCLTCKSKKNISLNFYSQLYHDFVSSPDYHEPDIIFIFNCGFHEHSHSKTDSWLHTIPRLYDSKCLTVFTSYNQDEAQKDFDRFIQLKPESKQINTLLQTVKNPFKSIRPHRDWETDSIYYQNNYISIVEIEGVDHSFTTSGVG